MCTVSFIRLENNDFILTSNRDEAPDRYTHPPQLYKLDDHYLLFPKDSRAGGTWIGISDMNRLVCVLNGAFVKHKRTPPYATSRGQIAKELLLTKDVQQTIKELELSDVEPFTMIIIDWSQELKVTEFVWDAEEKHLAELDEQQRIWSSSPLYDSTMKTARQQWFKNFIDSNPVEPESIWKFHHEAGAGNSNYGVIMDRLNVKTTSITQVSKSDMEISMLYEDLQSDEKTMKVFEIPELNNG